MSVTFTARFADNRAVLLTEDEDGDRAECNFNNTGAAKLLEMLAIGGDHYLCGGFSIVDASRALMRLQAGIDTIAPAHVVEAFDEAREGTPTVHWGGISEDSIRRRVIELALVVRQGIDAGATRITYG